MRDVQQTTAGRPWHLWVIGVTGSLWSVMGLLSFGLTQMRVEAIMSRFPPQQRAYFESFPAWAVGSWAIWVFAGLIGCIMLLFRNRLASPVLLASLVATIVTNLGGLLLLGGMEVMRETEGLGMTAIPILLAAGLAYYARRMSRRGVLR